MFITYVIVFAAILFLTKDNLDWGMISSVVLMWILYEIIQIKNKMR